MLSATPGDCRLVRGRGPSAEQRTDTCGVWGGVGVGVCGCGCVWVCVGVCMEREMITATLQVLASDEKESITPIKVD